MEATGAGMPRGVDPRLAAWDEYERNDKIIETAQSEGARIAARLVLQEEVVADADKWLAEGPR